MNQVLHEGAETAQLGILMGFTTIFFFTMMIGWTAWAFAPWRRSSLEAAGNLPFDGGER